MAPVAMRNRSEAVLWGLRCGPVFGWRVNASLPV